MSDDLGRWRLATRIARAGRRHGAGPVNPPVQRGSTVLLPDVAQLYADSGTYGLEGFEVHHALRAGLADIAGGCGAALLPSGLAACTVAILAFAEPGAEILVPDSVYGPTRRFCDGLLRRLGATTRYYPPRETPAFTPATRLLFLESPGSLTFEVQDVCALVGAAGAAGVATAIDDTWSAGVLFQPLKLGVDLSIQALTKHQGGHADLILGAIIAREPAKLSRVERTIRDLGLGSGAPEDAALVLRGLRTMPLRLAAQGEAGMKIARWLESHPAVEAVLHPALPSHADHAIFQRDFIGAAGVFGFTFKEPAGAAVNAALERLSLFGLGFSWGGFESLIIPCDPQLRRSCDSWSAPGALIRVSVGLEDPDDLIADLEQAFAPLVR